MENFEIRQFDSRFESLKRIGAGSFSTVFKIRDLQTGNM